MAFDYAEFLKTHYFAEFERRKEINSGVALGVGLTTVTAGAVVNMAGDLSLTPDLPQKIMGVLLVGAVLSLATATYKFIRCYVGHSYRYIASMAAIQEWRTEMSSRGLSAIRIREETKKLIEAQYAESVGTNDRINEVKAGYLHRANVWLVIALLFVAAAACPWTWQHLETKHLRAHPNGVEIRYG
jgi:hypothetical protein